MANSLTRTNIGSFLQRAANIAALPPGMTVERLAKGALIAIQNKPELLECSEETLASAIIEAGQLGLEPGGVMSEAYIVKYGNKAQFQIGYRGFRKLAYRNGWLIEAEVVRQGDEFSFRKGLKPDLVHVPELDTENRPLTHVYSIAWPLDGRGPATFEVMSKEQVDHIRSKSRAKDNGPWVTDYNEMARKTVTKRHGKILPLDPTTEKAIEYDNRADVEDVTWANVDPDTKTSKPVLPPSTADLNEGLEKKLQKADAPADEEGGVGALRPDSEVGAEVEDSAELDRLYIRWLELYESQHPEDDDAMRESRERAMVGKPSKEWTGPEMRRSIKAYEGKHKVTA